MVKHTDVVGFFPLLQRLDVVYAKGDGRGGYFKKPALAVAIVREGGEDAAAFLVPMVSINGAAEIDIAHEENIIGYDDGSGETDWKKLAEKYEAKSKRR
jgi:hypothetical protein